MSDETFFVGGEDIDFPYGDSYGIYVATNMVRNARCSISISYDGVGKFKRSRPFSRTVDASTEDLNIAACLWNDTDNFGYDGVLVFGAIKDKTSNAGIWVGVVTGSTRKLGIYKYDGTAKTLLASESGGSYLLQRISYYVALKIEDYGSSGKVTLYIDGNEICSYSGDISISGLSSFSAVGMSGYYVRTSMSEIVAANYSLKFAKVYSLYPNAAGDSNTFSGTYADIDEVTYSESDYISSNVVGASALLNLAGNLSGDYAVRGVGFNCVALAESATPTTLSFGVKSGGYVSDKSPISLIDGVTSYDYSAIFNTNPVTSSRFTLAEINALQEHISLG